jgi:hypothetical protein
MTTQPESRIVAAILEALRRRRGVVAWKIHGGPFQAAGIPDILGCYDGRFFGIEVKQPGGKATALQALTLRRIADAGGLAGVACSVDEARAILESGGAK